MSIKIYIFDMGGVVVKNFNVFPWIAEELQISMESFYSLAGQNYLLLSNGAIEVAEFWKRFSKAYGSKVREELFCKYFTPEIDWDIVEVIKRLKTEARVVCGTNTLEPHFRYHRDRGDYRLFHAVYASNQIGFSKPNPEFFRYILACEGAAPTETVFIDDTAENVSAASALGIKAILFTTPRALEEKLTLQLSN